MIGKTTARSTDASNRPPPWLSVIGIGEEGLEALSPTARGLLDGAELIVGGARHLGMLPGQNGTDSAGSQRLTWRSPLKDTIADIAAYAGRPVCVLATGDPMSFGIGVTLARAFGADAMTVIPVPGAFSLAAAHLAWPLETVARVTLHGRALDLIRLHLYPCARIIALSEDGSTPAKLAALLNDIGYGAARLTVLEHMGGDDAHVVEVSASALAAKAPDTTFKDLNMIAIECPGFIEGAYYAKIPGLPDDAYDHDGQLTKKEVRAATLAALKPLPGGLLWDVGCGNGSIAIEWMRAGGQAIGIEPDNVRRDRALRNAITLGVPDLKVVAGAAPDAFEGLPQPDAIFIGGGLATGNMGEDILKQAHAALMPGGRLVCNTVTLESEMQLCAFQQAYGGELTRIAVSRLEKIGPHHGWRPLMPVTQLSFVKPIEPQDLEILPGDGTS